MSESAPQDFIDRSRDLFRDAMGLQKVELDREIEHVEVESGRLDLEVYQADRLEKLVLSSIHIAKTGVVESSVLIWPAGGFDLPIYWTNLTQIPHVMTVPIFDFIPLVDVSVWPEYITDHMQGVAGLKAKAFEVLGDTVLDKALDLPSPVTYAMSPHKIVARISAEGGARVPEIAGLYAREYTAIWERAKLLPAGPRRDFSERKNAALKKLMRANDPGYPHMIGAFGKELTDRVFDAVF